MGRWIEIAVDERAMRGYVTEPSGAAGPGVLVCMHGPGIDAFIVDICERLSNAGFFAIAPYFYHRQAEPLSEAWKKIDDAEAVRDMAAAVGALKGLAGVDAARIGVIGFCMGGRLSFLHAANAPDVRAAVVFYGGNIMAGRNGAPSPFDQASEISAPVLGLFGADDENPSAADVQKIDAELARLNKAHTFHSYEGAGHAFLNFTREAVYREVQAKDAWAKCDAFLKKHLAL